MLRLASGLYTRSSVFFVLSNGLIAGVEKSYVKDLPSEENV